MQIAEDPRRFSTDPEIRVEYLRDAFVRPITGNRRISFAARILLACSVFSPYVALPFAFVPIDLVHDLSGYVFLWPVWGLFPFSSRFRGGEQPLGVWGAAGALAFWAAIIFVNAIATRHLSVKQSGISFVILAGACLAALHFVFGALGYTLLIDGP